MRPAEHVPPPDGPALRALRVALQPTSPDAARRSPLRVVSGVSHLSWTGAGNWVDRMIKTTSAMGCHTQVADQAATRAQAPGAVLASLPTSARAKDALLQGPPR